jgi:uncharacterized beta-barrel protein YwiB (DUF1934 family)
MFKGGKMQKVLLTIKGSQIEDPGSNMEFVTEGRLTRQQNGYLIEYDESDLTGSDGMTTQIFVEDGSVTMSRLGSNDTQLVFTKNSVYQSTVYTPEGKVRMNVLALDVKSEMSEDCGNINLEYELHMDGVVSAGKLNLSFKSLGEWIN